MDRKKNFLLTWNLVFWTVIFDAGGIFLVKLTMNKIGVVSTSSFYSVFGYFQQLVSEPLALVGLILFFSAPFLFAIALSRMEITTAYPVQVGLNFALLVTLSVLFLGESLNIWKIIGLVLICISTTLLYVDYHKGNDQTRA